MIEWIDINKEMPEDCTEVLMARENGSIGVGEVINCETYVRLRYNGTGQKIENWPIKVTHWAELPKHPKY